jgi:hypothetical protein
MSLIECPYGKHKYASKQTAELKIQEIAEKRKRMGKKSGRRRQEKYCYQCKHCGFWHLTKQKPRGE